jgi:hypothetical protein
VEKIKVLALFKNMAVVAAEIKVVIFQFGISVKQYVFKVSYVGAALTAGKSDP